MIVRLVTIIMQQQIAKVASEKLKVNINELSRKINNLRID